MLILLTSLTLPHKDLNDDERGPRRRRHTEEDFRDLKVDILEFDENLNLENYLVWVQAIKMIFELK